MSSFKFNAWNIHLHIKPAAVELQLNVYYMYIVCIYSDRHQCPLIFHTFLKPLTEPFISVQTGDIITKHLRW